MAKLPNRVVIVIRGGNVTFVAADKKNVELYVLDYDNPVENPASDHIYTPYIGAHYVASEIAEWNAEAKEREAAFVDSHKQSAEAIAEAVGTEPNDKTKEVWFWCIHCERAFKSEVPEDWKRGWFIEEVGKPYTDNEGRTWYKCPYDGCDGSPYDFIPWDDMREDDPSLPVTPEKNVVYAPHYDGFPDLGGGR
jgi:hypothetical protein